MRKLLRMGVAASTAIGIGVGAATAANAGTIVYRCVPVDAYVACAYAEASGMDNFAVVGFVAPTADPYGGTRGVIVDQNGVTVFESYPDSLTTTYAHRAARTMYVDIGQESETGGCYDHRGVIVPVRKPGAPTPYEEGFC